ncbi:NAD-dependent epimerase/dehydratase family protein [Qipengyuania profunda]|jgi:UDP-glucuronate 4-epimerase|uniref:NAD-dependent epimerase/dehydratase family protein n=1 Tax=Qipengyuania profunda TaxID=3113984 RepID=UPI002A188126|nr:NAD-dependent epimerase/dehydratase family protein [Qipengyuania sp. HL-TH1]WPL55665.1 NAD-dependent epimerase/dehydratase family protein [Qipengyuania sp. HL-TH5]
MGESRTALVTGSAGFIGYFTCRRLLADAFQVIGVDSLSDYYDPELKRRRQAGLLQNAGFAAINEPIETPGLLASLFADEQPDIVIHLAAQAGVRHSIDHPRSYLESNLVGTFELLEAARAYQPQHMLLASTSSAYGANTEMPYRETMKADHPLSFYAATKKATEAMAHSYAHLFDLPVTMFRFFTVYGPWGRPDMALFKFTRAMLEGEPIDVYNHGEMMRDFTYVEDLVEAVRRLIDTPPVRPTAAEDVAEGDSLSPVAPWRVVNIGNSQPVQLGDMIGAIEDALGIKAKRNLMPMQPGDVPATWADAELLRTLTGYVPQTDIREGVQRFVAWYRDYYGV